MTSSFLPPAPQNLSAFNTFGLASRAAAYVRIDDAAHLPALASLASTYPSLFLLGGGSNVVLPATVTGLVGHMATRGIRRLDDMHGCRIVEAAAGENWHDFVTFCIGQGWDGLENLALIPGTVGASPVQNIGAYGVELMDRFDSLTAYDLHARQWVDMDATDCRFAYRDSRFKAEPGRWIVSTVRFRLPLAWQPVIDYPDLQRHARLAAGTPTARAIFDAVCEIRRNKLPDPAVIGNAGSFFKNPVVPASHYQELKALFPALVAYPQADGQWKLAAGWLIDQCGWKGRDLGRAGVHAHQALVLVNRGGAEAADILALAEAIRKDVALRYGVPLEAEPVVVGGAG